MTFDATLARVLLILLVLSGFRVDAAELRAEEPALPEALQRMVAEARVALVIGNAAYKLWPPLANPVNDARLMAQVLAERGFKVTLLENATREQMDTAIRTFGGALKNSGVGLFYYAGHGSQHLGQNYLIPVDADILTEDDIDARGVSAQSLLNRMGKAQNRLNIVVLDACRTLPVKRNNRDAGTGLARMQAPNGTLIAYATAPNAVAKDGRGNNSPYTKSLAAAIGKYAGLKLEDLLKTVRAEVRRETDGAQEPWIESSIDGDFYFDPKQAGRATVIYNPTTPGNGAGSSTAEVGAGGGRMARWREVGAGIFTQTTEEFTEADVMRAIGLSNSIEALWSRIREQQKDPSSAMGVLPIVNLLSNTHIDCQRWISARRFDACESAVQQVSARMERPAELREEGEAMQRKIMDDAKARAVLLFDAVRSGKPTMALAPVLFDQYDGKVTQQDVERAWRIRMRAEASCMTIARQTPGDVSDALMRCSQEQTTINAFISQKRLDEAQRQLDLLLEQERRR